MKFARSKRTMAVMAVVPILAIAGCGSDSDGDSGEAIKISTAGTVRGVGVGSSSQEVKQAFGGPVEDKVGYPVQPANADPDVDHKWSEVTGPYDYGPKGPPDKVQRTLIYGDISFYTLRGKVIGYLVTGDGAETAAGVSIGDELSRMEEAYADAACDEADQAETTSVREEHCDVRLESGVNLNATDSPIESFTVGAWPPV